MMKVLRLLPNGISLLRILAVPLTVYLLLSQEIATAFWVIIVAGVSDGLDGYLAKRLNAVTRIGTYLDPLADKTMLIAVCLCLAHLGFLPCWIIALAILRDLLILGGVLLSNILELELNVDPILISKLNTVLQIFMVSFALGHEVLGWDLLQAVSALVYLVAFTTVVSGTLYLARWTGTLTSGGNQASGVNIK
jgi:cardiolipin synthase